jgi:alkanesulfonate monooxygenase
MAEILQQVYARGNLSNSCASPCIAGAVPVECSDREASSTQEDLDEPATDADRHVLAWPRLSPRGLAAATADVVYCLPDTLEAARAYYVDVKGRMAQYGRAPDDLKILPGLRPTVGRTTAEAHAKFHTLQALLDPLVGLSTLASTFGDLSGYPLDGPVPVDRQGPQDLRSISERLRARVRRDNPTIRQLSQQVAGMGSGCNVISTAEEIANVTQAWFEQGACDGFNITPPYLPGGCDDFVDLVIPVLQERGLFRTAYEGTTLREHLGLKPAVSRHARDAGTPAAE